jgi:hypothetical protein
VPAAETLTGLPPECSRGHHCGIRSSAEGGVIISGHCPCPECRCPESWKARQAVRHAPGTPMCATWYERSGGARPWEALNAPTSRTVARS